MNMEREEVVRRLRSAYSNLVRDDVLLFKVDANERSLTHKLAEHLQAEFLDWDVDCEYNRDGHESKRLNLLVATVSTDDTEGKTVFPDVIVHHRNTHDNLVVIEAKKNTTASTGNDETKLKEYKSQLGYRFAFAVVFPVGAPSNGANAEMDIREVGDESN